MEYVLIGTDRKIKFFSLLQPHKNMFFPEKKKAQQVTFFLKKTGSQTPNLSIFFSSNEK
jgi:hypothetical protein